ncbi:MAG: hypothetical protein M3174_08010 [Actinomycetota bacterium]|nr:hypothetical protein [Actinomycetota bacterium]
MPRQESGQSLIEAILVSVLILVPVLWAIGILADLHRTALATTSAAREAGFEAARSSSLTDAEGAAVRAVAAALRDHGLNPSRSDVDLSLSGLRRGAFVEVRVSYPVPVTQVPLLGRVAGPAILVDAEHATIIDPYRSRP